MGLQLKQMRECLLHNSVDQFLALRDHKYAQMEELRSKNLEEVLTGQYLKPMHFRLWLVGYTSAVGSFTYRQREKCVGYSISVKGERYIIELIRQTFEICAKVRRQAQDD
jgi:lipoate synthase